MERAGGHCECCGLWYGSELQWHHAFGRTEEPWASELTVMLDDNCHRSITDELRPDRKEAMRWLAIDNLLRRHGLPASDRTSFSPNIAVREAIVNVSSLAA